MCSKPDNCDLGNLDQVRVGRECAVQDARRNGASTGCHFLDGLFIQMGSESPRCRDFAALIIYSLMLIPYNYRGLSSATTLRALYRALSSVKCSNPYTSYYSYFLLRAPIIDPLYL